MVARVALPETLAEARPHLFARVAGAVAVSLQQRTLAAQGAFDAAEETVPVVVDYALGAVLDLPDADVPVSASLLSRWGVGFEAVLAVAEERRAQLEASIDRVGTAHVISGVPFAAAVLRDPAAVQQLRPGGTPVIVIPDAGTVVLGFAEEPESLQWVAKAAEHVLAGSSRWVSAEPLVRAGGAWEPFVWPAEAAADVARLNRRRDSVQYGAARQALQPAFEDEGVAVAELVLAEREGAYSTYATLVEGVESVVPRVDELVLASADGRVTRVPFDEVAAVPGLLEPVEGVTPAYSRVRAFPAL